jgi:hypothetical protein
MSKSISGWAGWISVVFIERVAPPSSSTPGTPSNSDWAQGYQLANQMNFKFPRFSPTHLSQVQYTHLPRYGSLTFPMYSTLTFPGTIHSPFPGTVHSPSKVWFTHLSHVQYTHLPRYNSLTFPRYSTLTFQGMVHSPFPGTVHSPSQVQFTHLSQVQYTHLPRLSTLTFPRYSKPTFLRYSTPPLLGRVVDYPTSRRYGMAILPRYNIKTSHWYCTVYSTPTCPRLRHLPPSPPSLRYSTTLS